VTYVFSLVGGRETGVAEEKKDWSEGQGEGGRERGGKPRRGKGRGEEREDQAPGLTGGGREGGEKDRGEKKTGGGGEKEGGGEDWGEGRKEGGREGEREVSRVSSVRVGEEEEGDGRGGGETERRAGGEPERREGGNNIPGDGGGATAPPSSPSSPSSPSPPEARGPPAEGESRRALPPLTRGGKEGRGEGGREKIGGARQGRPRKTPLGGERDLMGRAAACDVEGRWSSMTGGFRLGHLLAEGLPPRACGSVLSLGGRGPAPSSFLAPEVVGRSRSLCALVPGWSSGSLHPVDEGRSSWGPWGFVLWLVLAGEDRLPLLP